MAKHIEKSDLKYSRSRKAWNAGLAGAATAAGGITVYGLFTEHGIDANAVGVAVGAIVTGFVGSFLTAFLSKNEGV